MKQIANHLLIILFRQIVAWSTALFLLCSSCVSVAAYQKMYLSDEDMQLSQAPEESYEISVEAYREGASGINGGKTGGGCGCN